MRVLRFREDAPGTGSHDLRERRIAGGNGRNRAVEELKEWFDRRRKGLEKRREHADFLSSLA